MPSFHIVSPYASFAMRRMAVPLHKIQSMDVTESKEVNPEADVNLHLPWHTLIDYEPQGKSKHIMAFTHANPMSDAPIYAAGVKADAITALAYDGRDKLINLGLDRHKISVIPTGSDHMKFRRRRIGVIATRQHNARKRMHLLLDLIWHLPQSWVQLIDFVIIGPGWDEIVESMKMAGGNVQYIEGITDDEELLNFYHNFDVLLATGYIEGGPFPVQEAMAGGVPILTPDYGFARDYLPEKYKYHNLQELIDKLLEMFNPALENAQMATILNWYSYVQEYVLLISEMLDTPLYVHGNDGTPRYFGLMKIVNEIKPRNIMEIGTYDGRRATQMIQRAARYRPIETVYYAGFDLFEQFEENVFRKELSKRPPPEHTVRRFLGATHARHDLFVGNSAQTLPGAFKATDYRKFDLVFIDGGHHEDTIRLDWENVQEFIHDDTVIVFDDYYYNRHKDIKDYGCNDIVDNLSDKWKVTYMQPITKHKKEFGELEIGMVEVRRA